MKVTTTTTPGIGDYNFFSHVIEGPNTIDFQWGTASAQTITLSGLNVQATQTTGANQQIYWSIQLVGRNTNYGNSKIANLKGAK